LAVPAVRAVISLPPAVDFWAVAEEDFMAAEVITVVAADLFTAEEGEGVEDGEEGEEEEEEVGEEVEVHFLEEEEVLAVQINYWGEVLVAAVSAV
jgi:hypothetical protein